MRRAAERLALVAVAAVAGIVGGRMGAERKADTSSQPAPPAPERRLIVHHRVEAPVAVAAAVPAQAEEAPADAPAAPARKWHEELDEVVAETTPDPVWAVDTERVLTGALADARFSGQRLVDLRCGADVCRATIEHLDEEGRDDLRRGLADLQAFTGSQINTRPVDGAVGPATTLYVMRPTPQ